jgi:hypothetical protein
MNHETPASDDAEKPTASQKPSRTEAIRQAVEEYANDRREI